MRRRDTQPGAVREQRLATIMAIRAEAEDMRRAVLARHAGKLARPAPHEQLLVESTTSQLVANSSMPLRSSYDGSRWPLTHELVAPTLPQGERTRL